MPQHVVHRPLDILAVGAAAGDVFIGQEGQHRRGDQAQVVGRPIALGTLVAGQPGQSPVQRSWLSWVISPSSPRTATGRQAAISTRPAAIKEKRTVPLGAKHPQAGASVHSQVGDWSIFRREIAFRRWT